MKIKNTKFKETCNLILKLNNEGKINEASTIIHELLEDITLPLKDVERIMQLKKENDILKREFIEKEGTKKGKKETFDSLLFLLKKHEVKIIDVEKILDFLEEYGSELEIFEKSFFNSFFKSYEIENKVKYYLFSGINNLIEQGIKICDFKFTYYNNCLKRSFETTSTLFKKTSPYFSELKKKAFDIFFKKPQEFEYINSLIEEFYIFNYGFIPLISVADSLKMIERFYYSNID